MYDLAIARILHILGVVLWIGGVAFVTTVLLPTVKQYKSKEERIDFFEKAEHRFARQARLTTFSLITAGLAVAMQSVLVSVVGYFFLIGKYGVRVGDRVQIGTVTGEVIDMGLVRMHLMELSGDGPMSPTGRVVAFANSIVFQASGGLFKQIPGVDLAWREITLGLPPGADQATIKDRLAAAVTNVIKDYREDIVRQTREIQKASSSSATGEPRPQVQLRFSAAGVDAKPGCGRSRGRPRS